MNDIREKLPLHPPREAPSDWPFDTDALANARIKAQEDARALKARIDKLDEASIDLVFREARSHYAWTDKPVSDALLHKIYEATIHGATSMNTCPSRFVFVKSDEAKEKLAKSLKPANLPKMMGAPVTVIIATDADYWQSLPYLFPHDDRRPLYDGKPEYTEVTGFRNGTMQGAYMALAARAYGLDVGAMSGFSNDVVDEEFFAGTSLRSNFLLNLGYADESALFPRLPRFSFDEACAII